MSFVYDAQMLLNLVLGIAALGMELFALADAARHDARTYLVAEKRTKTFWLVVLGICAVVGFITVASVLSLVGLLAVVGAGVYLADVRPELRRYGGHSRRKPNSGSGPYGSW